jgi:hypothetical protein
LGECHRSLLRIGLKPKTLLLLYVSNGAVSERDIVSWLEHSNATVYRRDILWPAHQERLIEHDRTTGTLPEVVEGR